MIHVMKKKFEYSDNLWIKYFIKTIFFILQVHI